jgi:hypothetical protein
VIPPEERAEVLGRVRTFLETNAETASGEFDHPLVTLAVRTVVGSD